MCLDTVATGAKAKKIEARFEHGAHGALIGYQILSETARGFFTGVSFRPHKNKVNTWCQAIVNRVYTYGRNPVPYTTGFHVCHDPGVAERMCFIRPDYCLAKVKVKGLFTFGHQRGRPIAVATERRIVKILKRFPKEKES